MTGTKWRMLGSVKMGTENVYSQEQAAKDIAALKEIHKQQVALYGSCIVGDMPDLDKHPVHLALVAERGGIVVDGFYVERILEGCVIGGDTEATAALRKVADGLAARFSASGYRLLRTFVPKDGPAAIGKALRRTKFKKQDEMYEHYLRDLR